MRLSCPCCGFVADADGFLAEKDVLLAMRATLSMPAPLSGPLLQYLRMFRPEQRALTARRTCALLDELLPLIRDARVTRNGRTWAAPIEIWTAALEAMIAKRDANKLALPLKSHGYLLEIVAGIANTAEAGAERRIENERAGVTPIGGASALANVELVPELRRPERDSATVRRGLQSMRAVLTRVAPKEVPSAD
jgi:hypothetical protein